MKTTKRKKLKFEIFILTIVALCVALIIYFAGSYVSERVLEKYWNTDEYVTQLEQQTADDLQHYINEKKISVDDIETIDRWAYENGEAFIKMFVDGRLVYDTLYGIIDHDGVETTENIADFEDMAYTFKFKDGSAQMIFAGIENFEVYVYADYLVLAIAAIVFLIIIFAGVTKKISYVSSIEKDLKKMEDSLEHSVKVIGNDELTYLAESINHLRDGIVETMENEKAAYESNVNLVTSLSHDVRTPLTSTISYLELVLSDGETTGETKKHIEIALERAYRLKELTDELFEHFLIVSKEEKTAMEEVNGNELIVQLVEENLYDLEMQGVKVIRKISDIESTLSVNVNLIIRLFDNIFSNIGKYADLNREIYVEYGIKNKTLYILFRNFKKKDINKGKANNIGLKNCKSIVDIHKGCLDINESEEEFEIIVMLPVE